MADAGGSIGEINLISEGNRREVRDVSIFADDQVQLDRIIAAMQANPGTRILEVRDEVLELHQKGKIAAAETIARLTSPGELMPNPLDKRVHRAVAQAVAKQAIAQGLARAEYVPYVDE